VTAVFGPVPSRRLGRSLGINNVPFKTCSYACVYCQLGATSACTVERRPHVPVTDLVAEVTSRLDTLRSGGRLPDYLTFVADGEPTLDAHLGDAIRALRPLGVPVAVITNASLLSREDVRVDLRDADWVSVKVDAVDERTWHVINRPHGSLRLDSVLAGGRTFAERFRGTLTTETMLLRGQNDGDDHVVRLADYLASLDPAVAYVAIPTRPTAEPWARAPDETTVNRVVQQLAARLRRVEYLIGYEGNAFDTTGDAVADLLAITAVHPMREEAVQGLFHGSGEDASRALERLVAAGQLVATGYDGRTYYVRRFPQG